MKVKEIKNQYTTLTSKLNGLQHKRVALGDKLSEGDITLTDRLIDELNTNEVNIKSLEIEINKLTNSFKFLERGQ